MAIEHNTLSDPELHEPKGASTANAKEFYTSDGLGSGVWQQLAVGSVYAIHTGAPLTITGSGAATIRIDTVETTGALGSTAVEFTANADGTLEYTGTLTRHVHIASTISIAKATAGASDGKVVLFHYDASAATWFEIAHSEVRMELLASGALASTAIHSDIMLDQGDKITLGIENTGGAADIQLVTYYLFAMGMTGA